MRPHSRHWRTKKQAGLKNNRPQAGHENLKKLPRNSPPVTLEITHVGGLLRGSFFRFLCPV